MYKGLLLLLFLLVVHPDIQQVHGEKFQACGAHLDNLWSLICRQQGPPSKRADKTSWYYDQYDYEDEVKRKRNTDNFIDFDNARQKKQLANECCLKPCDIKQLRSYC